MSDAKQPEHMRPIPDGGLKDGMPSWLKRPPAWRDMPTVGERYERALPEPDTSEIDPRTLVDVSDLPLWLQAIAARGELPVPRADAAVEHAVEVVHAAQLPVAAETVAESPAVHTAPDDTAISLDVHAEQTAVEVVRSIAEPAVEKASGMPVWIWSAVVALVIVIAVLAYFLA